jgi:hypothetical protein
VSDSSSSSCLSVLVRRSFYCLKNKVNDGRFFSHIESAWWWLLHWCALLQTGKQVVTRLLPKPISGCVSYCLFLVVVTNLEQLVITLSQGWWRYNRLATSSSINFLRADDIRLVGKTCCESVGLINLVTRW